MNHLLIQQYGQRKPVPRDPLDGLAIIILSQATNDLNCDRAFASLKANFPTWDEVAQAPLELLVDTIRCGGLANQKALRIQNILQEIKRDTGTLDLNWLKDANAAECRAYLSKFRGIGPKTIACVLLFFLDKPAFPVDTHVLRVARRLGWIRAKASAEEADRVLGPIVPDECALDLHVNLISHGRAVCRAEGDGGPRCQECVIRKHCSYGKGLRLRKSASSRLTSPRIHGNDFFATMERPD